MKKPAAPILLAFAALAGPFLPRAGEAAAVKDTARVTVLVDADGAALVRWILPEGPLPAKGFRLERSVGGGARQVVATLVPGSSADARVDAKTASVIREYITLASDPRAATDAQKKKRLDVLGFSVQLLSLGDPEAARLLGLSYADRAVPKSGSVTYTVVALSFQGQAEAVWGVSPATPLVPMALPSPPADLRAAAGRGRASLFWSPSPKDEGKPWSAVTWEVVRRNAPGGAAVKVSEKPVLLGIGGSKDALRPAFEDRSVPLEARVSYSVAGIDLLGRRGPESPAVEVFVPDVGAVDPPAKVTATAQPGVIRVTWEGRKNPNTAGYHVARSLGTDGPYFRLTKEPLTAAEYTDTSGKPGGSYYYRVSAVNRRGEEGPPSAAATALFTGARPPDAPAGVTAERKTGLIVLRWKEADVSALQGYRVERDAGDGQWAIRTALPTLDNRFEDVLPSDTLGTMSYRIVAIGLDGQASAPSAVLKVPLPKTRPPARPEITSVDGANGQVALQFRAGGEKGEAAGFLVLRSTSAADDGIVVHDAPLPKTATTFADPDVTAGNDYLYRLVTLDDAGNRSDPSEPARVRVGSRRLEALPAPKLTYQAKPYPRVVAEFAPPADPSARAVLERKEPDGSWRVLTGALPYETTRAIDSHPPKGAKVSYRLSVVSANGVPGPASPAAEIVVP